jgi:hypothetical protein
VSDIEPDVDGEMEAKAVAGMVTGWSAWFGMLRGTVRVRMAGGFRVAGGGSRRASRMCHVNLLIPG